MADSGADRYLFDAAVLIQGAARPVAGSAASGILDEVRRRDL